MGASYEILKDIVRGGCDLTLCDSIAYTTLDDLAQLAKRSGARITITTGIAYAVIHELCLKYGKTVAFIDGLDKLKKD